MTVETQSNTPQTTIEYQHESTKHFVKVVDMQLTAKPSKSDTKTYNEIYQRVKKQSSQQMTVYELLEVATSGAIFQAGKYEYQLTPEQKRDIREIQREDNNEAILYIEGIKAKGNKRVSTSLIVVDCDDDWASYRPNDVIQASGASGAYYSFSHRTTSEHTNIVQNAYRLIYELSEPVENELAGYIEQRLIEQLKEEFPLIETLEYSDFEPTLSNTFIFGTLNPTTYYDPTKIIDVSIYQNEWQELEDLKIFEEMLAKQQRYKQPPTSQNEYLEMAEFYAKNGIELSYSDWISTTLGIARTSKLGLIDEDIAIKIMQAFDFYNHDEAFYEKLYNQANENTEKGSSIASLIYHAKKAGFKPSTKRKYDNPPPIETERVETQIIEVERQLKQENILDILADGNKSVLIDSPTGSGKTTATVNALKRYLDTNTDVIAYIAMPSKALAEQTANIHGLGKAFIGRLNIEATIYNNRMQTKQNMFVGTYDKTQKVIDQFHFDNKKVILVIDEIHKIVSDHGYRSKAINDMMAIAAEDNVKLIGLSGTPEELDLTEFEKVYKVVQKNFIKAYSKIDFLIYQESAEMVLNISSIIRNEVSAGNRVLAFINNKTNIDLIKRILEDSDINAAVVSSSTVAEAEQEDTYKFLLKNERFPNDTQVILATSVIADGINILNESDRYVCLMVPLYRTSNIFNLPMIKQMANRLRNPYQRIIIPLFIKNNIEKKEPERIEKTTPYNIEYRYNNLLKQSFAIRDYLKDRFYNRIFEYSPSLFERLSGFRSNMYQSESDKEFYKIALQEEAKKNARTGMPYDAGIVEELNRKREDFFKIDYRYLRKQASEGAENYYNYFPMAFVVNVSRYLDVKSEVSMFIDDNRLNLLNETMKGSFKIVIQGLSDYNRDLQENLEAAFIEPMFVALQREYFETGGIREDMEPAKSIFKVLLPRQQKAITELVKFCTYEQALTELKAVTKAAYIYRLRNQFRAVQEISQFKKTGRKNATQLIANKLLTEMNKPDFVSKKEEKAIIEKLAKHFKIDTKKVKGVFNQMIVYEKKADSKGYTIKSDFRLITLDDIAAEHNFTIDDVCEMYENFKK
ncbi:DEAD/DEAH box helicase family protein [Aerococcus viridans]|uniref:DEAD/DEAH box helicase family protein n=1 Tax=Aerococcus viridans TaxID=1377 RepID=UPI003B227C90